MKTLALIFLFYIGVLLINAEIPKEKYGTILERTPRDYININGSYYYVSPSELYFTAVEAVRLCNDVGMKLISIESKQKEEEVLGYLRNNGYASAYWTSGLRLTNDIWIWSSTGKLIESYTNWFILNPDEPWLRDPCIFVGYDEMYWHDSDCLLTDCCIGFICEN